jgi:hypothetical protein
MGHLPAISRRRSLCSVVSEPFTSMRLVMTSTKPVALGSSSLARTRSWLSSMVTSPSGQPFRSAYSRSVMAVQEPSEASNIS